MWEKWHGDEWCKYQDNNEFSTFDWKEKYHCETITTTKSCRLIYKIKNPKLIENSNIKYLKLAFC